MTVKKRAGRPSATAAFFAGFFVCGGAAAILLPSSAAEGKDYPIRPVPFTQVQVKDAFWLPRLETNRTVTIPFLFKKNEETGRIDNFAIAGGLIQGKYKGERYNDTDVYKPIEGAAYSLMVHPDPALDRALDEVIVKIAAAQEPDGYLFTARTCDPAHPRPGIGPQRWVEETVSHELYNAGHLYEAAVAHFLATGKHTLLDVAVRNADLVASVKDDAGRAAVERGPLVYCAEGVDNRGSALAIPEGAEFRAEWRLDLLNGIVVLKSAASGAGGNPLILVPYYAWAPRGAGEMAVWLVRSLPPPS